MYRFNKILCPIDFSPNSLVAFRLASELAKERNSTLQLLHVVEEPAGPEVPMPFDEMEAAAKSKLERLAQGKPGAQNRCEVHVRIGEPGVEVLRAADELGADLIVMATHGRTGLRRLVLGNLAEIVVREAPCPVLTVRPDAKGSSSSRTRPQRVARKR